MAESGNAGVAFDFQTLSLERAGEGAHDVVVEGRDDFRQELDDGDLTAEAGPDGAELEADGAAADHHEFFRHAGEIKGVVARDDSFAVELHERQLDGGGAGGDDEVFGGKANRAVEGNGPYLDLGRRYESCGAGEDGDLAGLGEQADAADELGHDGVLALEDGGEIGLDGAEFDARFGGVVFRPGVLLAAVEERLAGNAADVEAGAAERGAFLDEGDLQAELLGAEGAHIAARAGADDDEIEFRRHEEETAKGAKGREEVAELREAWRSSRLRIVQTPTRRREGSSMTCFTLTRKVTACLPSTMRWS